MQQLDQTLICNRINHDGQSIQAVCITEGCKAPIPCCLACIISEDHKNHKIKQLSQLKQEINLSLSFLDNLSEKCAAICRNCELWNKQIQTFLKQIKQSYQLPDQPTLTELTQCVQSFRESFGDTKQEQLNKVFNDSSNSINVNLEDLSNKTNSLFKNQQISLFQQSRSIQKSKIKINEVKDDKFTFSKELNGYSNEVGLLAISKDFKYLASDTSSCYVTIWNFKTSEIISQYKLPYQITALQFSNDNSKLAIGGCVQAFGKSLSTIEIFDLTDLQERQPRFSLPGHLGMIRGFIFSDDSKYLVSVSEDTTLRVWSLQQQKELNVQICESSIIAVTYSHLWQLIACCDFKGFVYLFDFSDPSNPSSNVKWQAHAEQCLYIQFIKNATVIMTSTLNVTRFWNVEEIQNQQFNHFKQISNGGFTVQAYPVDDPQVILNFRSDSKILNIWNYHSKELIQQIEKPGEIFYQSFVITSDFQKIIIRGKNNRLQVFERK